jgi:hypothetical protein
MDLKQLKIALGTLLAGVAVGYFLLPHKTKVETREVVKTVVQEVVKIKNNTVTKVVTVKQKDGTETTTTDIVDTGTMDSASNSIQESVKEKIVTSNGVSVGAYALSNIHLDKPDYGLLIDVPVASKASIFVTGDTGKRIGAGIRVQF